MSYAAMCGTCEHWDPDDEEQRARGECCAIVPADESVPPEKYKLAWLSSPAALRTDSYFLCHIWKPLDKKAWKEQLVQRGAYG